MIDLSKYPALTAEEQERFLDYLSRTGHRAEAMAKARWPKDCKWPSRNNYATVLIDYEDGSVKVSYEDYHAQTYTEVKFELDYVHGSAEGT